MAQHDHADELLRSLFGSDSEEEQDGGGDGESLARSDYRCTPVDVPGLTLLKGWATTEEQQWALANIEREKWFATGNQAMHFGAAGLPAWLQLLLSRKFPSQFLPAELASRVPLFDAVAFNRYEPGQGIRAHVDLHRFQDGIAILSLGGPAVMHWQPCQGDETAAQPQQQQVSSRPAPPRPQLGESGTRVPGVQVLLESGDLLIFHSEARYSWQHGILAVEQETTPQGQTVRRALRTSVTLRRCQEQLVLTEPA